MNSKVVIAVAAVVILVGAGIGAFTLMNSGSKDGSDSATLSIDSPGEYTNGTYDKVIIGKGVGDGNVTLKGIKILKELIILGGGSHSVTAVDCETKEVSIGKDEGEAVRFNCVNTSVGEVTVTTQAIIETDANSTVQSVNATGSSVTIQGNDTTVQEVKATGNASVNVTGGNVGKVDADASTVNVTGEGAKVDEVKATGSTSVTVSSGDVGKVEASGSTVNVTGSDATVGDVKVTDNGTVSVSAGSVVSVDASGSTVNVTGEDASIDNLDLSGQSTVSVQNGTVDSMSMQQGSQVSLEVGADGTLQSVTYSDNVSVTTTGADTEDKLAGTDQRMADGSSTTDVTVNGQNQHVHNYVILVNADWSTLDRTNKTVTATVVCDACDENAEGHTVTKAVPVREHIEPVTCDSDGYTVYFTFMPGDNGSPRYDTVQALGHDYEKTCTWNEGHGAATIRFVCKHDSTHVVEFVMQDVQTQVTPATCTEKGRTVYTVSGTMDGVGYSFTDTVETDALGHDYGPEYPDWNTLDMVNKTVVLKAVCEHDQNHVSERIVSVTERVVEPTCTEGGYTVYFTDVPGDNGSPRYNESPALGHDYRKECAWGENHALATITFTCANDRTHVITFVTQDVQTQVTPATCTEKGRTVYTVSGTMDGVGYSFTDTVETDALGHDYGPEYPDWTTLDRENRTVVVKAVCERNNEHVAERTVTVTERIVEPTCESEGYTVYFTDIPGDNGSQRYDIESPLGHNYVPSYNWSRDHSVVTVVFTCENDESHVIQYTTQDVNVQETPATCTAGGSVTYSISGTYEGLPYSDTQTVAIDPLGHDYTVNYQWSNDGTACDVIFTCANNHEHDHTIHAEVTTTVLLEPDCDTAGCNKYSVSGEYDGVQYSDETSRDIPATGHTYSEVRFVWSQDNSACNAVRTCMDCGDELVEQGQVQMEVLTPADVGIEGEARYTATFQSYDQQQKVAPIPSLDGFTVTVFGGKVAKYGQEPVRSSITVAENTVVTVSQPGNGFTFWTDDYGDYIPGESFEILVICDLYVTAHYAEDFVYGDWVVVNEQTCTEDGLWYRESGDMREYRTLPAPGHISDGNLVIDTPATCTAEGSGHTVCERCHREIAESIPAAGHHYEFEVVVEANGSTVGKMRGTCTECDDVILRDYISPIYPSGDMVVTFDWSHVRDVTTADRDEIHTTWKFTDAQGVERQAYLYQIQRDIHRNGYTHGMDVTSWFFWADYGAHSPVYVARHNDTTPVYGGANDSTSWAVAGYVDNLSEFIYLIDHLSVEVTMQGEAIYLGLGLDNGNNASALFDLYNAWANVFNAGKAGLYQVDHDTYLGWECTVYYNEDESFYVNEDNCCVKWARSDMWGGIEHGDTLRVVSVNDEFTEPFTQGYWNSDDFPLFSSYYFNNMPTLENSTYFCIKLINGSYNSGDFTEGNYRVNFFNGDSRDLVMWIEPTIPNHYVLDSIEVLNLEGAWVAVPHVKVSGHYEFDIKDRSVNGLYRYMMGLYPAKFVMPNDPAFNGVYIRCVSSLVTPDSTVTVIDGTFDNGAGEQISTGAVYGGEPIYLSFEEIADKRLTGINVTIGDGEPQYIDSYYSYVVPEGSSVTIRPVYQDREDEKVRIDFTCSNGGSVDDKSGMYYVYDYVECYATPDYGYFLVGWFDVTGGVEPTEDKQCGWSPWMDVYVQRAGTYMAVFAPIDASVLAEDYTIILATNGFIHWTEKPVYLSALYGSTEYSDDRIYTHANPNLEPVHRWDMVSNLEKVEGELVNGDELTPQFPREPDEEFDVKYSGDYTTVNAIFESEVEYYDVTVYDRGEVFQQSEVAGDMDFSAPYPPEREGYDFDEWNTAEDGSGDGYDAGDVIEIDGDLALYAQWEAKTFRTSINVEGLSYLLYNINNPQGGVYVIVTYGQTAVIPANLAILYGATLTGWYYMQDGQKVPVAADGTGTIPYGVTDIYAEFEYKQYTMTFDKGAEDATGTMQNVTFTIEDLTNEFTYCTYDLDRNSITFQRPAYNLSKWSFNETNLGSSYTSVRIEKTTLQQADENEGIIDLTAVWSSKDYYVKYSKGDIGNRSLLGTLSSSSCMVKADAPLTLNDGTAFSCSGLTFYGWNTAEGGTGRQYAPGESVGLEFILANYSDDVRTITLYAQWAVSNYGVTFHGPDGAEYSTEGTSYKYNEPNTLPAISTMGEGFTVSGYTFLYWTEDPEGLLGEHYADRAVISALTTTGSIDLYGVWAPNTYTVVFDANGGEGSMDNQEFALDETKALTALAYSNDGSYFAHWCDVDYNQGEYFEDEEEVTNLCELAELTDHKLASTVTLYAIWLPVQQ